MEDKTSGVGLAQLVKWMVLTVIELKSWVRFLGGPPSYPLIGKGILNETLIGTVPPPLRFGQRKSISPGGKIPGIYLKFEIGLSLTRRLSF